MEIPADEFEHLGFEEFLREVQRQGADEIECLSCYENGALFLLDNSADLDALRQIEYVSQVYPLSGSDRCIVEIGTPSYGWVFEDYGTDFFIDGPISIVDGRVTLTFVAPQSVISDLQRDLNEQLENGHIDCDIRKVSAYTGDSDLLACLTSRQREVIERAFDAGYYQTPRQVSSKELAAQLGVDKSTVLEHLQRAENNLITSIFQQKSLD